MARHSASSTLVTGSVFLRITIEIAGPRLVMVTSAVKLLLQSFVTLYATLQPLVAGVAVGRVGVLECMDAICATPDIQLIPYHLKPIQITIKTQRHEVNILHSEAFVP
jgi:hypothetical protein